MLASRVQLFGENKKSPSDYQGGRDSKSIVDFGMTQLQNVVRARMGGKGTGSAGSKTETGSKAKGKDTGAEAPAPGGGKNIVTLTEDNFEELVMKSTDGWMVEFYAPWCGHCKVRWARLRGATRRTPCRAVLFAAKVTRSAGAIDTCENPTAAMCRH